MTMDKIFGFMKNLCFYDNFSDEMISILWFAFIFIVPAAALILLIACAVKNKVTKKVIIFTVLSMLLSLFVILQSYFIEFEKDSFYFLVILFSGGASLLKWSIPVLPAAVLSVILFKRKSRKSASEKSET